MHFQEKHHQLWEKESQKKLIDPKKLPELVKKIKSNNQTIVTLNGCFDIVHAGHLQIIYEASLQADCLIVALNSDNSIRKNKGNDKPIISLNYRLQMLSAFYFVDYVTWFEETDPIDLLEKIDPDVHVNGSEYGKNCIEKDVVRRLHVVDKVQGLSTTTIIEKVLDAYRSKA